ncbi:hypothetical protein TomMM35A_10030 [Sphingobium sp. TomMM35A]
MVAGCRRHNLAITLAENGEFIGMIGFAGEADVAELTYMISPNHWGRGYATEAARCVIEHIFEATPFTAITASAMTDNPASEAVLKKIGFMQEHVAKIFLPLRGTSKEVSFWRLNKTKH